MIRRYLYAHRHTDERGVTLTELMVSMTLLVILLGMITITMTFVTKQAAYQTQSNRSASEAQDAIFQLRPYVQGIGTPYTTSAAAGLSIGTKTPCWGTAAGSLLPGDAGRVHVGGHPHTPPVVLCTRRSPSPENAAILSAHNFDMVFSAMPPGKQIAGSLRSHHTDCGSTQRPPRTTQQQGTATARSSWTTTGTTGCSWTPNPTTTSTSRCSTTPTYTSRSLRDKCLVQQGLSDNNRADRYMAQDALGYSLGKQPKLFTYYNLPTSTKTIYVTDPTVTEPVDNTWKAVTGKLLLGIHRHPDLPRHPEQHEQQDSHIQERVAQLVLRAHLSSRRRSARGTCWPSTPRRSRVSRRREDRRQGGRRSPSPGRTSRRRQR